MTSMQAQQMEPGATQEVKIRVDAEDAGAATRQQSAGGP